MPNFNLSKVVENSNKPNEKLSAKTIWGKLVIKLRENGNIALHIVCGDITDVEIIDDVFVVSSPQQYIVDMLNLPENYKDIQNGLKKLSSKKLEIRQCEKQKSDEDNINILNKFFDNRVIVNKKEN